MPGTQCLHQEEKDAPRPQRWWIRGASPVFSEGLRRRGKQASLVSHPGATSDINPRIPDPNPIIDPGCPRSVGGIDCAAALCTALNIQFKLRQMDCEPFLHGYGKDCSDAEVTTIGIWDLPVTDMSGTEAKIPFYVTRGDGFLLLGNEIFHRSYQPGPENLLVIPKGVRDLSSRRLTFKTYTEPTMSSDRDAVRTFLLVVLSKTSSFSTFFSAEVSFASSVPPAATMNERFRYGKIAGRFANNSTDIPAFPFKT